MILHDFCCPVHGPFEAMVPRDRSDSAPCPIRTLVAIDPSAAQFSAPCNRESPWIPSPVFGRVKVGEVSRGKSDGAPFKHALSTEALADGMSMTEFKAQRRKVWEEKDRAERRSKL